MRIYSINVNKKLKSIDSFQSLHNLFRCSDFRITLFSKKGMYPIFVRQLENLSKIQMAVFSISSRIFTLNSMPDLKIQILKIV